MQYNKHQRQSNKFLSLRNKIIFSENLEKQEGLPLWQADEFLQICSKNYKLQQNMNLFDCLYLKGGFQKKCGLVDDVS